MCLTWDVANSLVGNVPGIGARGGGGGDCCTTDLEFECWVKRMPQGRLGKFKSEGKTPGEMKMVMLTKE